MELLKLSKPDDDAPVKRPISEAPLEIIIVYGCCLAIQKMLARGEVIKAKQARILLNQRVALNRAQLRIV